MDSCSLSLQIFRSDLLLQDNSTLHSVKLPDLPIPTFLATATKIENTLYVFGGLCPDMESALLVQAYDINTGTWSTLPPFPVYKSESAVINGQLTLIGGGDASTGKITNEVWSWHEEEKKWRKTIPPMPTERARHGVVQSGNVVAVVGGLASGVKTALDTVDILNTATLQWTTSHSLKLPIPMWLMKTATCDGHVYITCGWGRPDRPIKRVFTLPLSVLDQAVAEQRVQDNPPQCQWTEVEETPFYRSGLLPISHHPLVVGGHDSSYNSSSIISVFDSSVNRWFNVGHCSVACCRPCLLSVSCSAFIVIGGCTDLKDLKQSSLNTFELYYTFECFINSLYVHDQIHLVHLLIVIHIQLVY